MRELRRYEHVADKEHWCDRCCRFIQSGDMYEGMVFADKAQGIVVFKYHINPMCDFPPDPEDELTRDKSEGLETTMKIAA